MHPEETVRVIRGREHISYGGRLEELGMFTWRRLQEDLIAAF